VEAVLWVAEKDNQTPGKEMPSLEFALVNTLCQSAVLIKYSTFIRYFSDPLSVSDLHQSAAFISQWPLTLSGLHQSW
jgi:hypothetical protein